MQARLTNVRFLMFRRRFCKRQYGEGRLLQLKVMQAFSGVELRAFAESFTDLLHFMRREPEGSTTQRLLEGTFSWVHACSVEESDPKTALLRPMGCYLSRSRSRPDVFRIVLTSSLTPVILKSSMLPSDLIIITRTRNPADEI